MNKDCFLDDGSRHGGIRHGRTNPLTATGAAGFLHIRGDPISGAFIGLDKIQLNGFYLVVQFFADSVGNTAFFKDLILR